MNIYDETPSIKPETINVPIIIDLSSDTLNTVIHKFKSVFESPDVSKYNIILNVISPTTKSNPEITEIIEYLKNYSNHNIPIHFRGIFRFEYLPLAATFPKIYFNQAVKLYYNENDLSKIIRIISNDPVNREKFISRLFTTYNMIDSGYFDISELNQYGINTNERF